MTVASLVGAGLEVADKVLQVDLSIQQNQPGKTPVAAIVAPVLPPPPVP